jgi:predicted O-methyltransferase YrrM
MSRTQIEVTDALAAYVSQVTLRDEPLLKQLRDETATHPHGTMQISAEQGQFMRMLIKLMGATKCIEVGTFTGYSSLSVAMALPENGKLVACDVSEEFTSIARRYWHEAGLSHKIDLRLGPALDTLDRMIASGESGNYDFAFIDADKSNYDGYYERCLRLVRRGGLLAIDNMLWHGKVIDPSVQDHDTVAIRALNEKVHADNRVDMVLLPLGDGLLLARVR